MIQWAFYPSFFSINTGFMFTECYENKYFMIDNSHDKKYDNFHSTRRK
jgi:hypothetical protein